MALSLKLPSSDPSEENAKNLLAAIDQYYINLNQANNEGQGMVPIPIELFIVDQMPDITLYLPTSKIFRPAGMFMSQVEFHNLKENGVAHLLVAQDDAKIFTGYVDQLLASLPPSSSLADEKKVTLLRQSAINVMKDIFDSPTPENIEKGVKTVTGFVYVLMKDPKAYGMLLNLSSHDHYTLQHSVGVATNSIIIAHKSGIKDEKALIELGVGGLLHDVGKTKVDPKIINKPGPLDETEWAQMKQHAKLGYEIVKDNQNIGTRAKLAILQHHEEPSGAGYPIGLKADQIDLYAKIVTLADVYNALTTTRSYSNARPPFDAFKLIKEKLIHKIDNNLFQMLVRAYGGQI